MAQEKIFPNGFTSYIETHFEVTRNILSLSEVEGNKAYILLTTQGTLGLYRLAEELTDKFEKEFEGRIWDGDFFNEIDNFVEKHLQE